MKEYFLIHQRPFSTGHCHHRGGKPQRLLGSRCATVVTVKTRSSLDFQSPRQGTRWLGGWLHSCTKETRVSGLRRGKDFPVFFSHICVCLHVHLCAHTPLITQYCLTLLPFGPRNPFPTSIIAIERQSLAGDSPSTMTLHRTMWKFFTPQALKTDLCSLTRHKLMC